MDTHPTHAELWVNVGDGRAMCALLAAGKAMLMYLRSTGDTGLVSVNPHFAGPPEAVVRYTLSNGQVDEHPAAWAISRETALRALEDFSKTGDLPSFVHWTEG